MRLKFLKEYREGTGKMRRYFRIRGQADLALPGEPRSAEFMKAYAKALKAVRNPDPNHWMLARYYIPSSQNGIEAMTSSARNPKPNPKPKERPQDDPEQSKRVLEAAKAAEADETAKGADKAFKAVVKPRKAKR